MLFTDESTILNSFMRRISLTTVLIFCLLRVTAQQNVILEQIRTFSMFGPITNYWSLPEVRSTFISQLNNNLFKNRNAQVVDTTLNIVAFDDLRKISSAPILFSNSDSSTWHLYIDLYEFEPKTFYSAQPHYQLDSLLFKRAISVFQLGILIVDATKKIITNEMLTICVSPGSSSGFGISAKGLAVTTKGFTDMLNLGFSRVLNEKNEFELIEVKAGQPFYADNFILPMIGNYSITQTKTQKDIFSYDREGSAEMIRLGDRFYEELITKGKKKNIIDNTPLAVAINNTGNQNISDFVLLRQECRDVIRNKNYTLKLLTEINPDFRFITEADVFTQFLLGPVHVLLNETDTIAYFSITKNIGTPSKKVFYNKVTNGYDSSSVVMIGASPISKNIFYEYQIDGLIAGKPFSIRCSDGNSLKEISFDNKDIALAKGIFLPERFAIFDASLNTEILNQLLMIAFTSFYQ